MVHTRKTRIGGDTAAWPPRREYYGLAEPTMSTLQFECYIRTLAAMRMQKAFGNRSVLCDCFKSTMLSSGNHVPRDQIPTIYKEAIRRYEEITQKKLDDPAVLKLTSVDDLLEEV